MYRSGQPCCTCKKLGIPKESKESFTLLEKAKIIPSSLARELEGMVGFRNILVHQYQALDISIMKDVIENHLDELVRFTIILLDLA